MARRGRPITIKDYILGGCLTVLLIWLIFLNISIFKKEEVARATAQTTQKQLASIQSREQTLDSDIHELSTERGEEATLRETYGVARPGEGVIIVEPAAVATSTPPLPWYEKWFGWALFWMPKPASTTPSQSS